MKTQATCPTCGSICEKGNSDEGTNYFIPKKYAKLYHESKVEKNHFSNQAHVISSGVSPDTLH